MNLFLLAHQDDEYGVYPVLEELVARQEEVAVVYLTSGTFDGSLCTRRNQESLKVLTKIGLKPEHIHVLGAETNLPDGKLHEHAEQACATLMQKFSPIAPKRIFTPAWEGGHQDHDASHIIACFLADQFCCLDVSRQFPLYQGQGLPSICWHTFKPLPENGHAESIRINWRQRLRYLGYCLHYRSQWATWVGLYPMYALKLFTSGRQYLQPLSLERLQHAPHSGTCLYERRGFCTRQQFTYHTRNLIDKMSA